MEFTLRSPYKPTGDQPQAIEAISQGIRNGIQNQVLLGVTGSGKTFSMSNVIEKVQLPTLVISHNKTLAAQLYQEFRDFFPENAVSYFVSYYDYYQPEAYIPSTDTYIEKETEINDDIDRLRLAATTNLLTRPDSIVVASVSCIYNLGSPVEYSKQRLDLMRGEIITRETIFLQLANLQYQRSDYDFKRGTFRVRGDTIFIWPAYQQQAIRVSMLDHTIQSIDEINPLTGSVIEREEPMKLVTIYPAKHYATDSATREGALQAIEQDLKIQLEALRDRGRIVEAYRLEQRVLHDIDMIRELGFVNGIENYSRYFDGRKPNEAPYTLLDYFAENARIFNKPGFLTIVDESHITIPQVRGMYNGDRARKETLIEYGFRLPSALDNRPLRLDEFLRKINNTVYVSATPAEWEISYSNNAVVEQLVRPTGLLDPDIEVRRTEGQIEDLAREVMKRKAMGERVLITTLTKRMAEALTEYFNDKRKMKALVGDAAELPRVQYLHADVETLDRSEILDELRRGSYDVVVGINLLREGLDLPEVSLVAILDADKEGFLRSETSLIQTMGRAARHVNGKVILYADKTTDSMRRAIEEVERRRAIQATYNTEHGIVPQSISKPIREMMIVRTADEDNGASYRYKKKRGTTLQRQPQDVLARGDVAAMTPEQRKQYVAQLERRMRRAAKEMNFELAAQLRDQVYDVKQML